MDLRCFDALPAARLGTTAVRWATVAISFGAGLGCAGCSSPWQSLPPAKVSSEQYQDMTCEGLKFKKAQLAWEAGNLRPALFPTGGEEKRKADLAQVDGAIIAVGNVQADKRCPGFENGIAVGVDPNRPY